MIASRRVVSARARRELLVQTTWIEGRRPRWSSELSRAVLHRRECLATWRGSSFSSPLLLEPFCIVASA